MSIGCRGVLLLLRWTSRHTQSWHKEADDLQRLLPVHRTDVSDDDRFNGPLLDGHWGSRTAFPSQSYAPIGRATKNCTFEVEQPFAANSNACPIGVRFFPAKSRL
eukprot:scaffold1963_cov242-Pinguiococcus_pyrenoidosus.AAC.5